MFFGNVLLRYWTSQVILCCYSFFCVGFFSPLNLPCFSDKHSSSASNSDSPQARHTIVLLPPWICRAILMHIAECSCLPVVSSFSQDSVFSSCQSLAAVVPLFSPHLAASPLLTPSLLLAGACGTLSEASCQQSSAVLADAAPQPSFRTK